jgi:hypothetical protein
LSIEGHAELLREQLNEDARTYLEHQMSDSLKLLDMLDTLFQAERDFGEDSDSALNVDIHLHKYFERALFIAK